MRTIPTDPNDIILFATRWGQYPVTRRERHRLAILHGASEAEARAIAYDGAAVPSGLAAVLHDRTYSAHMLALLFDSSGDPRPGASPIPLMHPGREGTSW
jgi:hypothetical protein